MKDRELKQVEAVNFFATLLMRFSIISSISYKASSRLVRFTFLVRTGRQPVKPSFCRRWIDACSTLHHLQGVKPQHLHIKTVTTDDLIAFTYIRDLDTLSFMELSLSARLLVDEFGHNLVTERASKYISSTSEQHILAKMLDLAKQKVITRDLYVFREADRVIVADI